MDPNAAFDLSSVRADALADLQTPAVPAEQAVSTPPAETVVSDTPAPAAPATTETPQVDTTQPAAPAAPAEESARQKWVINRKGQQVEITDPTEVEQYIRQGYDYTQKTMELAEQRRQVQAQIDQAQAWLRDKGNVRGLLQRLEQAYPDQPAAPAQDPESLLTAAETQQAITAQLRQAQQTMAYEAQGLVKQAILEAETARYTQEYTGQVQQTMAALLTEKYPILADVDKVDRLILDDVADKIRARTLLEPEHVATIDEVKTLMVASAKGRADKLEARIQNHLKMEAVRAAKLTQKGAEPAGGAPPAPPADPKYKLGDKDLTRSVIAELQAAFDKKR